MAEVVKEYKNGEVTVIWQPSKCTHSTFCRCGASANKPYCDGSHVEAGFKDG